MLTVPDFLSLRLCCWDNTTGNTRWRSKIIGVCLEQHTVRILSLGAHLFIKSNSQGRKTLQHFSFFYQKTAIFIDGNSDKQLISQNSTFLVVKKVYKIVKCKHFLGHLTHQRCGHSIYSEFWPGKATLCLPC